MKNREDKMVFCTLFDSNYLDRGLVLYESMKKHIGSFRLYIFAFDDKAFEVLSHMKLKHAVLLSVENIMTEALCQVRKERTRTEFCWTCTPFVIGHVLQTYHEKLCTYIDADTFFFSSPAGAIEEILAHGCSVGLVEHRFERDSMYGSCIFDNGKYCIQFNTFLNDSAGMQVLKEWEEDCLNWCYYRCEDGRLGDQKYTDKWKQSYSCVHESENLGVGAAPWNLHQYRMSRNKDREIYMEYRGRKYPLVFYHFEGMKYLDNGSIYLSIWKPEAGGMGRKIRLIYGAYIRRVLSVRMFLARAYHVTFEQMQVDHTLYFEGERSFKQLCKEQGVLDGSRKWFYNRRNNIVFVNKKAVKLR